LAAWAAGANGVLGSTAKNVFKTSLEAMMPSTYINGAASYLPASFAAPLATAGTYADVASLAGITAEGLE